jgi:HSP20 family protein
MMARIQLYDPFARSPFEDIVRGFLLPVRTERGDPQVRRSFRIDVNEDDKSYVVTADLPGVTKDAIQVTIDGNQVTIAAESKRSVERKEGERALHIERHAGQLFRTFTLSTEIDEAASEAKFENGVLELRLAKKVPQGGRKLSIQ